RGHRKVVQAVAKAALDQGEHQGGANCGKNSNVTCSQAHQETDANRHGGESQTSGEGLVPADDRPADTLSPLADQSCGGVRHPQHERRICDCSGWFHPTTTASSKPAGKMSAPTVTR